MTASGPARQADRIYHDLVSREETLETRRTAREVAAKHVRTRAHQIATGDEVVNGFPHDVFDALSGEGLFGAPFAKDVGGWGLEHRASATAAIVEELAYYSNSVAAIFDVHCILAGHSLDQGDQRQRERWLRPLLTGEIIGAFATSEPGASSDLSPRTVLTTADSSQTGWTLSGRKRWITNSPVAGIVVVLARTGDGLSLFIVPTDTPGVGVGRPDRKMGNRGQLTADVVLDDVRLEPDALLGQVGGGLKIALNTLTYGRIGIAAAGVGMAQAAFDLMAARLTEREAFGRKLGSMQHWQFLMADRARQIENARNLYIKAAVRLDSGERFPEPEASMAKVAGTEVAVDIARDAAQLYGAAGFVSELGDDGSTWPIEAIYRDSKIGEIYEGANEVQQWIIARQILGRELTG